LLETIWMLSEKIEKGVSSKEMLLKELVAGVRREAFTCRVLGESEDENLLCVATLEIFGLTLDPFKRVLRPIRALMK